MTSAMHAVMWPSITPSAAICRFLPEDTFIFGYARSKLSDDDLRKKIKPGIGEGKDQDEFLSKIKYIAGQYDGSEGYQQVRPKNVIRRPGIPPMYVQAEPWRRVQDCSLGIASGQRPSIAPHGLRQR